MSTPFSGKQFTFTQPDGTELWVKGWGNQQHAVFECLNGYTIVKDPITGFFTYADLSSDGETLLSTGVRPRLPNTKAVGLGIESGIRVTPEAAKAQAMQSSVLTGKSRWEMRREQLKEFLLRSMAPGIASAPPTRQTIGDFTGLCMLIQFPDQPAGTITQQEVDDFCNKEGYNGYGNNGSVYDYFHDISGGKLHYKNIVTPYYTAKNPQSYYSNPSFPPGMMARVLIKEALTYFKEQGFDFSRLTSDNQNYVYAISAYYAGWCPNNWNFGLWPHQWSLFLPLELAPGKLAYDYQITDMTNQLSLGTFCHENGHMICDFPDLYDYGQESAGIGNFCLMCSGNHANQKNPTHVNAYLKYKAGWAQVTGITAGMNATIQAGANQIYIHRNPSRPTEYFIIENREQAKRDLWLPGSGLAIWHIDELGDQQNQQMSAALHYECSLVQADGRYDLEFNQFNRGDASDLFGAGGVDRIDSTTKPHSRWWDGTESGLEIHSISAPASVMTFKTRDQGITIHAAEPLFTVNTTGSKNLRDGNNVSAKTIQVLTGKHTLTGDYLFTATTALPSALQRVGDQWLHITAVDGKPFSCYLAIIHNGTVYNIFSTRATHLVKTGERLNLIADKYGTSVDKILEANTHKFRKPGHVITKSWIEAGWVLNIPD